MTTTTLNISHAFAHTTLSAGADSVYVRVSGHEVGPIAKGDTDAQTAAFVAAAVTEAMGATVVATSNGPVVTLMALEPGASGNALTLDAEATVAGVVIPSGPTFAGGVTLTLSY